ncbi:MAG: hypothetical protein IJ584_13700 [Bacteroidales bacterium]|nr:hypothetical protein [Bacteroidales bacterium]
METAVKFLKHVYSESVPDIANILVAEADGDVETIKSYLMGVRDYIDKLINEIGENEKDSK